MSMVRLDWAILGPDESGTKDSDQQPLHLMNSYLHGQIRLSFAGDSHTATTALHLLDIAYGAEPESCVDDAKIMPPQPTKETTNAR